MGKYAEININIDLEIATEKETIIKFKEEIRSNKELNGTLTEDKENMFILDLYLSSGRIQNLQYQLELLEQIFKKYPSLVVEAYGTIMVESEDHFFYEGEK